jgi:8-oxo-dGTP diphosphatase
MEPRVGVSALIFRDGQLLLGRRRGSHGAGLWSTPGGHLEWEEDPVDAVRREVGEETALTVLGMEKITFTNDVMPEWNKHYITLYYHCQTSDNPVQTLEPDKCEGWHWFALDSLPSPLWPGLEEALSCLP